MASLLSRDCVFGNHPKANAYVAGWPLPNGVTVKSPSFITPRTTAFSPLLHKQCIHVSILRSHLHVLYLPLLLWDPPYYRSEEPPLKLRPLMKGLQSLRWDYSVACKFLFGPWWLLLHHYHRATDSGNWHSWHFALPSNLFV